MIDRTTKPPEWLEAPPELQGRLRERAAWITGACWLGATYVLYLVYDALMATRSADLRFVVNGTFGIAGIFWPFAAFLLHERLYVRLLMRAEAHYRRFGAWPR